MIYGISINFINCNKDVKMELTDFDGELGWYNLTTTILFIFLFIYLIA